VEAELLKLHQEQFAPGVGDLIQEGSGGIDRPSDFPDERAITPNCNATTSKRSARTSDCEMDMIAGRKAPPHPHARPFAAANQIRGHADGR
jgi:hypothetical protein